jgi:molybdate transport system permease protein
MMETSQIIWTSLMVAATCAILSAPFAIACGWWLARRDFFGKTIISMLTMTPLVLPPVVTGYLLLICLGRRSTLGQWLGDTFGLHLSFAFSGAVLAAMIVGFPLFVAAARIAFEGVEPRLEEMGRVHGASPWNCFWKITLPLAAPGILAGATLSFARALGEFGATAVFAGTMEGETPTLAVAVYTLLEDPNGDGQVLTLTILSLVVSFFAIGGYEWLIRRQKNGSMGRPLQR